MGEPWSSLATINKCMEEVASHARDLAGTLTVLGTLLAKRKGVG